MALPVKVSLKIFTTIILLVLFLFVNFYTVRRMTRYGLELYFYDKMLVAYQIAGLGGLKTELGQVISFEKIPGQVKLAEGFEKKLAKLPDPGKFLNDITNELKNKIKMLKNLRIVGFGFIILIVISRFMYNRYQRLRGRTDQLAGR